MKGFLIFIDILGFDLLPREIAKKTGFNESKIRQEFISKPFKRKLSSIRRRCINVSEAISEIEGSDCYILLVNNLQVLMGIICDFTKINIPHKDYGHIPVEVAIDMKEIKDEKGIELINRAETIEFLKNDILKPFRNFYKSSKGKSIKDTFLVSTENFINELDLLDRKYCQKIKYKGKTFFSIDKEKVWERCKVYEFLERINIKGSKIYDRINDIYIPPLEYQDIKKTLEKNRVVFITGTTECGKTYTAIRLLWEYFNLGYTPIWISGAEESERIEARKKMEDIERELKPNQILYFEDPFGRTRYERRESLERKIGEIIDCVQRIDDSYLIITSREEVFKDFEKEHLSSLEIKRFEQKLNLKKPSYEFKKRKQILIKWAESKGCEWLENSRNKNIVINSLKDIKNLPTPLSIREFVLASFRLTTKKELYEKIAEKSESTAKVFAREIENMSLGKTLFLTFPFIHAFKFEFVEREFNALAKKLKIDDSVDFNEVFQWFREDKIDVMEDKIKFIHPSYEQAKYHLLFRDGHPTKYNREIFSKVIDRLSKKHERIKLIVALELVDTFNFITEETKAILKKLIKKKKVASLAAIAIINNYTRISKELEKILENLIEDKEIAVFVALFISDYKDRLPSRANKLKSKILSDNEVASACVWTIFSKYDYVPERTRKLALKLTKKEEVAQRVSMRIVDNVEKLSKEKRKFLAILLKNEQVAVFTALYLIKRSEELSKGQKKILENILRGKEIAAYVAGILVTHREEFPDRIADKFLDKLLDKVEVGIYLCIDLLKLYEELPKNNVIEQIKNEVLYQYLLLANSHKQKKQINMIEINKEKVKKLIKDGYMNFPNLKKQVEIKDKQAKLRKKEARKKKSQTSEGKKQKH